MDASPLPATDLYYASVPETDETVRFPQLIFPRTRLKSHVLRNDSALIGPALSAEHRELETVGWKL